MLSGIPGAPIPDAPFKRKVAAFILRPRAEGGNDLLFHGFVDEPWLPERVPGGGANEGETPEVAMWREIREETGLERLSLVRNLGVQRYYKPYLQANVERHDFLLYAPVDTPDVWEYCVTGDGDDFQAIFSYRWIGPDELNSVNIDEEFRPWLNPHYLPDLFI
jgi:hypothetical protein